MDSAGLGSCSWVLGCKSLVLARSAVLDCSEVRLCSAVLVRSEGSVCNAARACTFS